MMIYRILLVIDALVAALCLFVFGWGLFHGAGSTSAVLVWLAILAVIGAVIWGARRLAAGGNYLAANILLGLIALAAAGIVLFFYAILRALGGP